MFDAAAFIASLPAGPGVYRMLDASDRVLYVGKAKNLRRRVSTYFGSRSAPSARIAQMVRRTASMQATPVASESEALVLERSLIRALRPRYNILFRDDTSYPYLVVTDETWPRLLVRRRPLAGVREAFGPYPASERAHRAADLLRKVFRIRGCDEATFAHRSRPCLQHQMGRCSAPCVGLVSADDYAGAVDEAGQVLRGKAAAVRQALLVRMQQAAERLDFERAAALRDRIADLAAVAAGQSVDGVAGRDTDVLAIAERHGVRLLAIGMLRAGRWMGERFVEPLERDARLPEHDARLPEHDACPTEHDVRLRDDDAQLRDHDAGRASDAELLDALLLAEYAASGRCGAQRLVLPADLPVDAETLEMLAARGLRIARRQSADMRRWQRMTREAAELQLRARERRAGTQRERAASLAQALGRTVLARIECFDVSHTHGEHAVAACVVWEDGLKRAAYRRYNVAPPAAGDDCAALEEAIDRRFDGSRPDEAVLPQLLVVDGGPGQVDRARQALARAGIELPVLGLAKGRRRIVGDEVLHRGWAGDALRLPPSHPGLLLLQEIRDEAHRFALAGHRSRRAKARLASPLDAVRGLGPARKKALLQTFGGLAGVQGASVETLGEVRGLGPRLARAVWQQLHGDAAGR